MSRATAVATSPAIDVAPPRTAAAERETRQRHLAPVPPPARRPARGPFIAVLTVLLGGGLLILLALNTALAQGSFVAFDLRADNAALAEREQDLLQDVAAAESPQELEESARRLGMVPAENPVFLRLSDGKVLGVPLPAQAPVKPKPVKVAAVAPAPAQPAAARPAATQPAAKKPQTNKPVTPTTAPEGNGQ